MSAGKSIKESLVTQEQESSHTSLMEVQRFRAQLQCRHRTRPADGQPDGDTESVSTVLEVEQSQSPVTLARWRCSFSGAQLQCRHRTRPVNGQPDRDTKSVSAVRAVERRLTEWRPALKVQTGVHNFPRARRNHTEEPNVTTMSHPER